MRYDGHSQDRSWQARHGIGSGVGDHALSFPRSRSSCLLALAHVWMLGRLAGGAPTLDRSLNCRNVYGLNPAHVPYWRVNNPTLGEFCFTMIACSRAGGRTAQRLTGPSAGRPSIIPPLRGLSPPQRATPPTDTPFRGGRLYLKPNLEGLDLLPFSL